MNRLENNPKFSIPVLVCLIALTYGASIRHGFIWDDDVYLTDRQIESVEGLKTIWVQPTSTEHPYYPITHTLFWVLNKAFGRNASIYHAINVVFHIINCLLVFLILSRLRVRAAWMCAAVFALHPVHVESVAWVAQIKNTLSALFYLLSMFWFIEFYFSRTKQEDKHEKFVGNRNLYFLSIGMFMLSMLSKTAFCMLPIGLLLIIFWKRGKIKANDVALTLPYFGVAVIVGLFTIWMEYNHVGSHGEYFPFSIFERTLIAGRAVWFYAIKLVLPFQLNFVYPRWTISLAVWWQYLFPVSIVGLLAVLWWKREKIGLGVLAGVLFFIAHLFPVMGFLNIYMQRYTFVTDHWQYVASLGVIVILISGLDSKLEKFLKPNIKRGVYCVVLIVLAGLSFQQAKIYKDRLTLFNDIVQKDKKSWFGYLNRGTEYLKMGESALAVADFKQALNLNPELPEAYNNIGNYLSDQGQYEKALDQYARAIKINPGYYLSYVRRGVTYYYQKNYREALKDFELALKYKPDYPMTYNNRGLVYEAMGRDDLAMMDFEKAVELDSFNFAISYYNRARISQKRKQYGAAIRDYSRAIAIDPDYVKAYSNRGVAFLLTKRFEEAKDDFLQALAIEPGFASARKNLGILEQREHEYYLNQNDRQ